MHIVKKYFKLVICFSFVLTVLFQILLMNDSVKEKVSTIYRLESQYVYSEQKLPKGNVLIEISSPDSNVYVLQNGETIADFSKKECRIDVFDNSVIEIDGRNSETNFEIKIKSVSDNLEGYYENKVKISRNIVILGRFFVK